MVVNIHEAKTQLSRLIEKVQAGEEVVIAKAGKPVARLVRSAPSKPVLGHAREAFNLQPGWDAPLTDAEMKDLFGT